MPTLKMKQPMTVAGQTFETDTTAISLTKVKLDPHNPRIRYLAETKGISPKTNKEICELLLQDDDIKRLYSDIKREKGLHDPILVNKDGTIIEGNSRTACYLTLQQKDKTANGRWDVIPARVLCDQMSAEKVSTLQAYYHIRRKNNWAAYAQAEHFFRMNKDHGLTPEQIHENTGMQEKNIRDMIESYRMMRDHAFGNGKKLSPELAVTKYSYFLELQKSGNPLVKEFRAKKTNREQFAKWVDDQKFERGAEVRKLGGILKSKEAQRAFEDGGMKAAGPVVNRIDPTLESGVYRQVKKLSQKLNKDYVKEITRVRENPKCATLLEDLNKLIQGVLTGAKR